MQLIEIFKAGKRTDANGVVTDISVGDLQQTAQSYDPDHFEAPIVIGHPQMNNPAYGWVKGLQMDGDVLKAEVGQVEPQFAEMVRAGRFKKISASFYLPNDPSNPKQGVLSLRHIGFLGAMPPAVKGLKTPIFNETEQAEIVEFCQPIFDNHQGEPEMDKDQQLAELQAKLAEAEKLKDEAEKARLAAEDKAKELEAEKTAAIEAKAIADLEATKAANVDFAENLVKAGKLAPAVKEKAIEVLACAAAMSAGRPVEFSEGESVLTLVKDLLDAQPQIVQFGEFATAEKVGEKQDIEPVSYAEGADPLSIEQDQKIRVHMKQHNVDYVTAFKQLFY